VGREAPAAHAEAEGDGPPRTQILMEILIRKEWIWWKEAARMVIISSDRTSWSMRMVR
jgi:hypothetical protein